jgi:hypothetical protein
MTTNSLFNATVTALCSADWAKARACLDELSRRADVCDYLARVASWPQHILDRVDLVNSKVERAAR